ncbi:MAG: 4Fe-4S binding protein [Clostridiales bacterium]|nr:4Fe-4S binding protein [Clostridiales bacterium]
MSTEYKVFDFDLERCSGCFACVVACMDQNDIDTETDRGLREVSPVKPLWSVTKKLGYISLACMHCDDAPCIAGCPTGCLGKDENGLVVAEVSLCIGCHSCIMNCPNGAPKFGADGKISKCNGCAERVESGLIPACVRVCPTKALKYDLQENIEQSKKDKMLRKLITYQTE